jgi:hypothetical protein
MPDEKTLEAGRIARNLVTLWLDDKQPELLDAIERLLSKGDNELLTYTLLEQLTTTGQLGLLLAEKMGTTGDQILQSIWTRHDMDDFGL